MKKSSFVALVLGTVSGVLFALGMCMALVAEWNMMKPGIILGLAGVVMALVTWLVWRKMENMADSQGSWIMGARLVFGVGSGIGFGIGMCLGLVGENFVLGTVVGLAGVVMLLGLIPMIKGLK